MAVVVIKNLFLNNRHLNSGSRAILAMTRGLAQSRVVTVPGTTIHTRQHDADVGTVYHRLNPEEVLLLSDSNPIGISLRVVVPVIRASPELYNLANNCLIGQARERWTPLVSLARHGLVPDMREPRFRNMKLLH